MKKLLSIPIVIMLGFLSFACDHKSDNQTNHSEKKEIVFGLPPSMHNMMLIRL